MKRQNLRFIILNIFKLILTGIKMNYIIDVNEIKHLVCVKCGWGFPLIPSMKFRDLEIEFRKQHEGHPLSVLTIPELHELAEKRSKLRIYANIAKGWAKVNRIREE